MKGPKNSVYYKSLSDFIYGNSEVKEGYAFHLKVENDPIPPGLYMLDPRREMLRHLHTGQEYPANLIFNGRRRVDVTVESNLDYAARSRIEKELSREAVVGLTSGVKKKYAMRVLSKAERAEIETLMSKVDQKHTKTLQRIIDSRNTIIARKALVFDFESWIDQPGEKIGPNNVFSVGLTNVYDKTYTPNVDPLYKESLRKSAFRSQTYYDINKTRFMFAEYYRKRMPGFDRKPRVLFGKQNVASLLQHMVAYVSDGTVAATPEEREFFERSRNEFLSSVFGDELKDIKDRVRGARLPSLERIMEEPSTETEKARKLDEYIERVTKLFETKSKSGKRNIMRFLSQVAKRTEEDSLINLKEAVEHKGAKRYEFDLGVINYGINPKRGSGKGRLMFSKSFNLSVTASLLRTMADNQYETVYAFGSAERNVILQLARQAEEELGALKASGRMTDPEVEARTAESIRMLKGLEKSIVDTRAVMEQFSDYVLPEIRTHLKNNASGIRNAVEKLLGYENAQRIQDWGIERFTGQKHSGFSLENLYALLIDPNYRQWHVGYPDAADTGNMVLFLSDLMEKKKRASYRAPSSQNLGGMYKRIGNAENRLFHISSKMARNVQIRTVLSELFRNQSTEEIARLASVAFENSSQKSKELAERNTNSTITEVVRNIRSTGKPDDAIKFMHELISLELREASEKVFASRKLGTFKYEVSDPGILSRVISKPPIAKAIALGLSLYVSAKTAAEDPGASIETGEHNSMETVARRIVTTPFNSAISKSAIGLFAERLKAGFTGSIRSSVDMAVRLEKFFANFLDDSARVQLEKRALMPAASSMEARMMRRVNRHLMLDSGTKIPALRRPINRIVDSIEKSERRVLDFHEKILSTRKRVELKDFPLVSGEVIRLHKRATMPERAFWLGSTGPYNHASFVGLSFRVPSRDVFLYGDPISFMRRTLFTSSTDELFGLYNRAGTTLVKPSFSPYWSGRSKYTSTKVDVGSVLEKLPMTVKEPNIQKIKDPQRFDNLASYLIGTTKTKGRYIPIPVSEKTSTISALEDAFMYKGVIQSYKPMESAISISRKTLIKAKDQHKDLLVLGIPERQKVDVRPVVFKEITDSRPNLSGLTYAKSPKVELSQPILPERKKVYPTYHKYANEMLQNGNIKKFYPKSANEHMAQIMEEALAWA